MINLILSLLHNGIIKFCKGKSHVLCAFSFYINIFRYYETSYLFLSENFHLCMFFLIILCSGFDYRPFVINWLMSLKVIDGYVVDAIERYNYI